MTTIEITVETLDELVKNPEIVIGQIMGASWNRRLEDEDLSVVIRGYAGHVTPEDALASFQESYSQHVGETYGRWQGASPWKMALKELFDFRTNAKEKLSKHALIALYSVWVGLQQGRVLPGVASGGLLETGLYLSKTYSCSKAEQFYHDLMNASISVEEVIAHKAE